jgi:DNA-binding NarL/FixJ family response regulator
VSKVRLLYQIDGSLHFKRGCAAPGNFVGGSLRILVADDQAEVRRGICTLIEAADDLEVCAEAANGEEALEKTIALQPDLVLLDISMPVMNGFDAAKAIRACCPATPILMVSIHEIGVMVDEARDIGVNGYVAKDQVSRILIEAIRAVTSHHKFFPEDDVARRLH